MEALSSTDNPAFRALLKLSQDAKARREQGLALAEGPHLVDEALASGRAKELWLTPLAEAGPEAPARLAKAKGLPLRRLAPNLFDRLADAKTPQGWLAVVHTQPTAVVGKARLNLALDGIQDPGNLGTLFRAAWAAQAQVLLGPGCADPWSPKCLRSGAGAQFHVPFQTLSDLPQALQALGVTCIATLPRAPKEHLELDLQAPHCWVLGAEGGGLSPQVIQACQEQARIAYPGAAESLNAAVSGAILLFESLRQGRPGFGIVRS